MHIAYSCVVALPYHMAVFPANNDLVVLVMTALLKADKSDDVDIESGLCAQCHCTHA